MTIENTEDRPFGNSRFAARHYFGEYSEGVSPAWSRKNGWCFLDKHGAVQLTLPADCCSAQPFSEGLAAIAIGGKPWNDVGGHSSISPLSGAKFGFIDKSGKFVIPPTFPGPSEGEWKSKFQNGTYRNRCYYSLPTMTTPPPREMFLDPTGLLKVIFAPP